MDQDKHFYIIIGLLLVIVALLVLVLVQRQKPITSLLENCNQKMIDWKQKYPIGTTIDDSARNELSLIVNDCISKVGDSK